MEILLLEGKRIKLNLTIGLLLHRLQYLTITNESRLLKSKKKQTSLWAPLTALLQIPSKFLRPLYSKPCNSVTNYTQTQLNLKPFGNINYTKLENLRSGAQFILKFTQTNTFGSSQLLMVIYHKTMILKKQNSKLEFKILILNTKSEGLLHCSILKSSHGT